MMQVMISYRNVDGQREFARSLEKAFTSNGIKTWIDVKDIPRLSRWEDEIFKGIITCDYVVLCLSPEYFESETCLFECYVARGYGKILLPVVVPFDSPVSVFDLISRFEETRGLDHLNILDYRAQSILGMLEDHEALTQRLIKAVLNPTLLDIDYDVYFSYRWSQVVFATQIADDLNQAGIKTFIYTRTVDPGVDWRRASWSAELRAKIHAVILSPDVRDSEYIKNEVLVTRTKKDAQFVPILAQEFANDENAKSTIRKTFSTSKNLSVLNDIQWSIPKGDYRDFIKNLISDVKLILSRNDQ